MDKKAQAAAELAIFGAILIFILGTIIRSAVGNSYTQNQNFKTMRMALLASWNDAKATNTSHNSASILFVEDRLSPDFTKYGDLDRNPFIAQGSGSFTYELLYPLDPNEVNQNVPIMDVYINGQHFPFTTASYVSGKTFSPPQGCAAGTQAPVGQGVAPSVAQNTCLLACPLATDPGYRPCVDNCQSAAQTQCLTNQTLRNQREWVCGVTPPYKLFYTMAANGTSQFVTSPPVCGNANSTGCKDKALNSTVSLGGVSDAQGDLMYDLGRLGLSNAQIESQFPLQPPVGMRSYIAWQWAATAGTVQGSTTDGADPMIGLDPDNNQYPPYDINGTLKPVTIYTMSQDTQGDITVGYEDFAGGDIDGTWDVNSCGPKPGLQNNSQILTFTLNGTYLQVKEGHLYNPETGQFVRSINQRDNIDIVQRTIQLSNNTQRFCPKSVPSGAVNPQNLSFAGSPAGDVGNTNDPNPVEVCVDGNKCTCFMGNNTNPSCGNTIAETCYDTSTNIIWVRSRIEDRRGNFWLTNASGQLKVQ